MIGAGQAGLSTAHHLARLGLGGRFVVLDGAPGPGGAWRNRWASLTLGRAHGVHDLPGLPLADAVGHADADADRPASEVVAAYFDAYERHFDLPVRRPVRVRSVRSRADGRLVVRTDDGITMVGTRTARDPRVHLVGYGPSASTIGATRAGRAAAVAVRDRLREPVASGL